MLHIGIDARLIHYRRGMGTVVYSLINEWVRFITTPCDDAPIPFRLTLYVDSARAVTAAAPFANDHVSVRQFGPAFYPLWEQWLLPRQVLKDEVDVLYCPANTAPIFLPAPIKLALTIHDVMYLLPQGQLPTSPSLYQRLGRHYRRWVVPKAARRANLIVTDSQFSRRDILQYLGRSLSTSADAIQVVTLAAAAEYGPQLPENVALGLAQLKVRPPYILGLGAIDPRKNTTRLIEAFAQLENRSQKLVITGLDPAAQAYFGKLAQQYGLNLGNDVILLGFVSERELAALYAGATLLLYPSLYEGFGLPVLEAMACGTPVITSNTSSIPEIAGEAALLIDPTDITAMSNAMQRLIDAPSLRQQLIKSGWVRASQFNWQFSAKLMLTLLSKVVGL
ncbi:MAG: glycosyltransferase family 1 protein [Chloroflexota bacterium]|jgi:glycosyltransferase involved in cell wall biosynthesis|nr:glycosyltransferase family 4 protein [Chloroflexota bacterium]